jgi:hypothetical protein
MPSPAPIEVPEDAREAGPLLSEWLGVQGSIMDAIQKANAAANDTERQRWLAERKRLESQAEQIDRQIDRVFEKHKKRRHHRD